MNDPLEASESWTSGWSYGLGPQAGASRWGLPEKLRGEAIAHTTNSKVRFGGGIFGVIDGATGAEDAIEREAAPTIDAFGHAIRRPERAADLSTSAAAKQRGELSMAGAGETSGLPEACR